MIVAYQRDDGAEESAVIPEGDLIAFFKVLHTANALAGEKVPHPALKFAKLMAIQSLMMCRGT